MNSRFILRFDKVIQYNNIQIQYKINVGQDVHVLQKTDYQQKNVPHPDEEIDKDYAVVVRLA